MHLGVSRNSGATILGGVAPPGVVAAFADQMAAVLGQVLNQRAPLHRSDDDQFLGEVLLRSFAGFLAVKLKGFL